MEFNVLDFIVPFVFTISLLIYGYIKQNKNIHAKPYYKFFLSGLMLKIIGGIAFALVYKYYYGGGDTFSYYQGIEIFYEAFKTSPNVFLKMFFLNANEFTPETYEFTQKIWFFNHGESYFLIKIGAILNLLSFNSYMGTTVLFSFFSFIGSWYLYKAILFFEPFMYKYIGYAVFYIPSVVFWGSGIMKDTICFGAMGILLFCLIQVVSNYKIQYLIFSIFFGWIILQLKAYIVVTLTGSFFLFIYWEKKDRIRSSVIRIIAAPIILIIMLTTGYFVVPTMLNSTSKYKTEDLDTRIEGFHSWHTTLAKKGGSGYNLGDVELTPIGMLKKFPASVNVTLFRPYLWEIKNIVNLIAALESLLFLTSTLYIILSKRTRLFKLLNSAHLKFFLLFSLLLAFIVGFTSYNFGALVRFKIPLLPFYSTLLIVLLFKEKIMLQVYQSVQRT